MIYPHNNIVSYIDTISGDHGDISINDLLMEHYHETTLGNTPASSIVEQRIFTKGNILIKDWNGWTKLLDIVRRPILPEDEFFSVGYDNENIILSRFAMMPVYSKRSIDNPTVGFHGEQKYENWPKTVGNISEDEYIRYYGQRLHTINGFTHVTIRKTENIDKSRLIYMLHTESKYFNLGNFYVF